MKSDFEGRDDLLKIHEASLFILEKTGFIIHDPVTRKLLEKNGFKLDGSRVFFPGNKVLDLVKKAPERISLAGVNQKKTLIFGHGIPHHAPGFGAAFVRDLKGSRRAGRVADYIRLAKLGQVCPQIDLNGGILVQPGEVPPEKSAAIMQYLALLFTDKCLIGHAPGEADTLKMMQLLACALGCEQDQEMPSVMMGIINCNSPLQYDSSQLESLRVYLDHGQSVSINGGVMAGNTGPVTMAGALALGNAEVLAGIAMSQLMKPGAPVFYGLPLAQASDLNTAGTAIGGPESSLGTCYGARLAKIYKIPTRGCAGPTDAQHALSPQAAMESMLLQNSCYQHGVDVIVHAAGILDSYLSISLEKYIMDCEILSMLDRVYAPLGVNEETLALDAIHEVGPGGNYVTAPHTFKHCRKEMFIPDLAVRGSELDDYTLEYSIRVQKKLARLEASYTAPQDHETMKKELNSLMRRWDIQLPKIQ